jgi:thymidylate kinase
VSTAGAREPTAALIHDLIGGLDRAGVDYCHWKSNWALERSLAGARDLDLFVRRGSMPAALGVLSGLGFRTALVGSGPQAPGTSHHYGVDPVTGRMVHVHLATRLLTGESAVKSHLLPLDAMVLDNRERREGVRVVSRPAELVLFVLRTFIKYGSPLDALRLVRDAAELRAELAWLERGGDLEASVALLQRHCPVIEPALFLRCLDSLREGGSLLRRIRLARQVRRRLRVYARHTPVSRGLANLRVLWAAGRGRLALRRTMKKKTKRLGSGGAVIAFVGGDATGKSTLTEESAHWLGQALAVRTVHAGKPPAGWLTLPLRAALPVARGLLPGRRRERTELHGTPGREPGLLEAVRAVALAWERCGLLVRARRHAASGEIVICDRYPSEDPGAMDSPRLREPAGARRGPRAALVRRLALMEQGLYRRIPPPDLVLRLRVSLETARRRNRERPKRDKHGEDYLEFRHRQSAEWSRRDAGIVHEIDTDGPLAETLLRVKRAIWESL